MRAGNRRSDRTPVRSPREEVRHAAANPERGPVDEHTLMERLEEVRASGRRKAVNQILAAVRPEIRAYLTRKLDSLPATEEVARELTQETLFRISRALEDCRAETPGGFRAWRRTIARNIWTDYMRRRGEEMDQRRAPAVTVEAIRVGLFGTTDVNRPPPSPVDRAIGELLLEAQQILSDDTARIIRQRFIYGDTWREAGRAVGTTRASAKRRWQWARERLRKEVVHGSEALPEELREEVLRHLGEEE